MREGRERDGSPTPVENSGPFQQSSSHTNAHTVAVAFAPNTLTSRRTGSPGLRSGPFRAVSRCCPRDYLEIKVQNHGQILILRIVIAGSY